MVLGWVMGGVKIGDSAATMSFSAEVAINVLSPLTNM